MSVLPVDDSHPPPNAQWERVKLIRKAKAMVMMVVVIALVSVSIATL